MLKFSDRLVLQTPIVRLWDDYGEIAATRSRSLDIYSLKELLRREPIRFVRANPGLPLEWFPVHESFDLWKSDVASKLKTEREQEGANRELTYHASEWVTLNGEPTIVLLEVSH